MLLQEYATIMENEDSMPSVNLKVMKNLGYFEELVAEREALHHHNESIIQNARERMQLLQEKKDLNLLVIAGVCVAITLSLRACLRASTLPSVKCFVCAENS